MTSRSNDDLHPQLAYAFGKAETEWMYRYPESPRPFLICTYRNPAEQDRLYNQPSDKIDNDRDGKTDEADERVTNAKAGQSPHNFLPALAFDIAFKDKAGKLDYSTLLFDRFAPLVLTVPNITWGGRFKSIPDKPHFELTDWKARSESSARVKPVN